MKNLKKVRIFSAREVANICGVVNQTSINWIKNGFLKAFTTPGGQYRVYSDNLIDFLNKRSMRIPEELRDELDAKTVIGNILIVDDDKDLNDLLYSFLNRKFSEYSVNQAFNGFEAGRIISDIKPNIVILDIDLPGIDGFKISGLIKKDPSLEDPIVLAISGLDDPDVKNRIISSGADDFLSKPLDFKSVVEKIEHLIVLRKQ